MHITILFAQGEGRLMVAASVLRRHRAAHKRHDRDNSAIVLSTLHPAHRTGRTMFPSRVFDPDEVARLLKDGHQSRKIGKFVTKGKLRGFPIFTLTLEERATCPRSCLEWSRCYGNSMQAAERIVAGPALEAMLWDELSTLQTQHPGGFLVRLHVLGDFYSVRYAELWHEALEAYPALHIFGYTARLPQSEIGQVVCQMIGVWPERFHVRFSGWGGANNGAIVVERAEDTAHIICPAQTDPTGERCCGNCTFCFATDKTIAFLRH